MTFAIYDLECENNDHVSPMLTSAGEFQTKQQAKNWLRKHDNGQGLLAVADTTDPPKFWVSGGEAMYR